MKLRSRPTPTLGAPARPVEPTSLAPTKRRQPRSVSRTIYLLVLAVLAGCGLWSVGHGLLFWRVPGVVDLGQMELAAEHAGRVTQLFVAAGTKVEKGQVVAEVVSGSDEIAAELARLEAARVAAELHAEKARTRAEANRAASRDRFDATRLRADALDARADWAAHLAEVESWKSQRGEVQVTLAKFEDLESAQLMASTASLDLRVLEEGLSGKIRGGRARIAWLERKALGLEEEARRLDERAEAAAEEAIAASRMVALEARRREAEDVMRLHEKRKTALVRSPVTGFVSWVHRQVGEVVTAGEALLVVVPEGRATVIAYPEDDVLAFAVGQRVNLVGPDFRATGQVKQTLREDRQKPASLVKAYERAPTGPAVLIELVEIKEGMPRAGAILEVTRSRLSAWWR